MIKSYCILSFRYRIDSASDQRREAPFLEVTSSKTLPVFVEGFLSFSLKAFYGFLILFKGLFKGSYPFLKRKIGKLEGVCNKKPSLSFLLSALLRGSYPFLRREG